MRRVVDFEDDAFEFVVLGVVFETNFLGLENSTSHELCVHLDNLIVLQAAEIIRSARFEVEVRIAVGCDGKVAVRCM